MSFLLVRRVKTRLNSSPSVGAAIAPLWALAYKTAAGSGATGNLTAALGAGNVSGNAMKSSAKIRLGD